MKFNENINEIVEKWNKGEIVWSVSLGGIGPSYEQAIQELLFGIISSWGDKELPEPKDDKYPEEYNKHVDEIVHKLKGLGFSGAQVSAAKSAAWQFMKYGYYEMMNKAQEDRLIQVDNRFFKVNNKVSDE